VTSAVIRAQGCRPGATAPLRSRAGAAALTGLLSSAAGALTVVAGTLMGPSATPASASGTPAVADAMVVAARAGPAAASGPAAPTTSSPGPPSPSRALAADASPGGSSTRSPGTEPAAPGPAAAPVRRLIVRADRVDVVLGGRRVSTVAVPPGPVEIGWLAGRVPAEWTSTDGATVRLTAELSLGRGAVLDVGPRVTRLELAGGATPVAAISVHGGTLRLTGTTVASVDPRTGGPVPAGLPGRPWLSAGAGSQVDVRDSLVTGLGTGASGPRSAGLFFGSGATGSVLRSTFADDGIGLVLAGSQAVSLAEVTVIGSALDGLRLGGDTATALRAVTSTDNGRDGISILGGDGRRLAGLHTARNGRDGVRASRPRDLTLTGLRSADDRETGLVLAGCQSCVVDHAVISGGRAGVQVSGRSATLTEVRVSGARVGVRLQGKATDTLLDRVTVSGGQDGVVATAGTRGLTVLGSTVTGVRGTAFSLGSSELIVQGATVRDASVGAHLRGDGRLADLRISGVARGIRVGARGRITAEEIDVAAARTGIEVDRGGSFGLASSRVRAARALVGRVDRVGRNSITLPPFPWFGLAGLVAVLLALGLETLHRAQAPPAPDHLLTTT